MLSFGFQHVFIFKTLFLINSLHFEMKVASKSAKTNFLMQENLKRFKPFQVLQKIRLKKIVKSDPFLFDGYN